MPSDTAKVPGIKEFEASDYLDSPEECAAYLQEFIGTDFNNADFLIALGDVIKAQRKMSFVSKTTGLSREGLYKSLSENGNPSFKTIAEIVRAIGLQLSVSVPKQVR